MKTVLLVGLRLENPGWEEPDTGGFRRLNWEANRARWEKLLPEIPIFEGHHEEEGPFSLAKASNRAAALAGDWEMAVYTGADFMVGDAKQVHTAIAKSEKSGMLTLAFDHTVMLYEWPSQYIRDGGDPLPTMGDVYPNAFTGVMAVPRSLWDRVGGFEQRLLGWGWDDQAFWASCWAIGGGFDRVKGYIHHLWHPRSRSDNEESPYYRENEILGRRYLDAKTNRLEMMKIIAERTQ